MGDRDNGCKVGALHPTAFCRYAPEHKSPRRHLKRSCQFPFQPARIPPPGTGRALRLPAVMMAQRIQRTRCSVLTAAQIRAQGCVRCACAASRPAGAAVSGVCRTARLLNGLFLLGPHAPNHAVQSRPSPHVPSNGAPCGQVHVNLHNNLCCGDTRGYKH